MIYFFFYIDIILIFFCDLYDFMIYRFTPPLSFTLYLTTIWAKLFLLVFKTDAWWATHIYIFHLFFILKKLYIHFNKTCTTFSVHIYAVCMHITLTGHFIRCTSSCDCCCWWCKDVGVFSLHTLGPSVSTNWASCLIMSFQLRNTFCPPG